MFWKVYFPMTPIPSSVDPAIVTLYVVTTGSELLWYWSVALEATEILKTASPPPFGLLIFT